MTNKAIEIGTVLWSMRGTERNGIIKWYASPQCVEYIDDSKFLCGNGCGGSFGLIGKTVFLSRQEALDHFLASHDSLEEKMEIGSMLPEEVYSLPRTDWNDKKIYKWNHGVNECGVYIGRLSRLKDITEEIVWDHIQVNDGMYYEQSLTLRQIYEQVSKIAGYYRSIITVIQDDPMRSQIYQCNNYENGFWVKLGEVQGYA